VQDIQSVVLLGTHCRLKSCPKHPWNRLCTCQWWRYFKSG